MTGHIFDIKELAVHDGPGIRTTVFFKGCPLRCKWCHNPEGLTTEPQLMYKKNKCIGCGECRKPCDHPECKPFGRCIRVCPENCLKVVGREVSAEILADELISSADMLGDTFGGFTFSGGEPLMQSDFMLKLIELLSPYHLCIETSGYADEDVFRKVVDKLDFVIMDLKLANNELHKKYTGVSNEKILKNFNYLKSTEKPCIIRTPLIPGITDTEENLNSIAALTKGMTWEKIPYNAAAGAKYKMLGMEYGLSENQ